MLYKKEIDLMVEYDREFARLLASIFYYHTNLYNGDIYPLLPSQKKYIPKLRLLGYNVTDNKIDLRKVL